MWLVADAITRSEQVGKSTALGITGSVQQVGKSNDTSGLSPAELLVGDCSLYYKEFLFRRLNQVLQSLAMTLYCSLYYRAGWQMKFSFLISPGQQGVWVNQMTKSCRAQVLLFIIQRIFFFFLLEAESSSLSPAALVDGMMATKLGHSIYLLLKIETFSLSNRLINYIFT